MGVGAPFGTVTFPLHRQWEVDAPVAPGHGDASDAEVSWRRWCWPGSVVLMDYSLEAEVRT